MDWITFPVYPAEFLLRTVTPFDGPEYRGGLFRGGFGKYFRELVCTTGAPACGGCPHLDACPYSKVFETPVQPEKMAVLRKYPNAPHPFVLRPPPEQGRVTAGHVMRLGVTWIGPGLNYLPHFIRVFDEMGRGGTFGGKFRVETVRDFRGVTVFENRRIVAKPAAWSPPPPSEAADRAESVCLRFTTPLRMRTDGEYNQAPDFVDIARTLLRRVSLLEALYGAGDFRERVHELMGIADRMVTRRRDFRLIEWSRVSGRQQRRIAMDGVVGEMDLAGDLVEWMRWLRLGELIHIGNGTSMGLGRYEVVSACGSNGLE
jgi:hypothetical protein